MLDSLYRENMIQNLIYDDMMYGYNEHDYHFLDSILRNGYTMYSNLSDNELTRHFNMRFDKETA